MEEHCREKFNWVTENMEKLTVAVSRVSEVVFNGYGEAIQRTDKRLERVEEKLDGVISKIYWIIGIGTGVGFAAGISIAVFIGG